MSRKYELSEAEAELAFTQIASHCEALKNWIVTAVESDDFERAKRLVSDYRKHQDLFRKLNVTAHREIDKIRG